jgi:hypothetical protein
MPAELEYEIEVELQRLSLAPDDVTVHETLRTLSLRRKADGGPDLGMFEKMKLGWVVARASDHKDAMLAAEKLLSYDPGNVARMVDLSRHAHEAGFIQTAAWIDRIIRMAAGD